MPTQDLIEAGLLRAGLVETRLDRLLQLPIACHLRHLRQSLEESGLNAAQFLELCGIHLAEIVDVHETLSLFQRWASSRSVVTSRSEVWRKSS